MVFVILSQRLPKNQRPQYGFSKILTGNYNIAYMGLIIYGAVVCICHYLPQLVIVSFQTDSTEIFVWPQYNWESVMQDNLFETIRICWRNFNISAKIWSTEIISVAWVGLKIFGKEIVIRTLLSKLAAPDYLKYSKPWIWLGWMAWHKCDRQFVAWGFLICNIVPKLNVSDYVM